MSTDHDHDHDHSHDSGALGRVEALLNERVHAAGDHEGPFAHTVSFDDYQLVLGSKHVNVTRYQPMERKY